jgi:hypothetical protein
MSEKGLTFFYFYNKILNPFIYEEDVLSSKKSKLEEELEVWWKFDLSLFGFIIHLTGSAKPDMESQR